jgi:hypothetical protein
VQQSFRHASPFDASPPATDPAAHRWPWPIARAVLTVHHALREALAAHRHYERAVSRGIRHDAAIRRAFGISHRTSAVRPARLAELDDRLLHDIGRTRTEAQS